MDKTPENKTDVEKLLKEKMDGLASNVDCFDKIAERAFPAKKAEPAEKWISVGGVEKAKNGRGGLRILKWTAAAACVALVALAVPKTITHINTKDRLSENKEVNFDSLVAEILSETEKNDYRILDVSLEKYARQDFLVTPLYSCPFSYSGEEANVRTFIRLAGGVPTNQIYAVEYSGDYAEENFIAVAKTSASFDESEIKALAKAEKGDNPCESFLPFAPDAYYGANGSFRISDPYGNAASPAGFSGTMFFKEDGAANYIGYDFVYDYAKDTDSTNKGAEASLVYDYIADCAEAPAFEPTPNGWAASLRRDDSSALPENDDLAPKRIDIFGGNETSSIGSFKPFANADYPDSLLSSDRSLNVRFKYPAGKLSDSSVSCSFLVPEDSSLWDSFTAFYACYGDSVQLYIGGATSPADLPEEKNRDAYSACYERLEELSASYKDVRLSQEEKETVKRKIELYYKLLAPNGDAAEYTDE